MKNKIPNTIYGPVSSWRLGKSLGVDLLCIDSVCSFECVYCQLGKINHVTSERGIFVETKRVINDLIKSEWNEADVITLSGSGEPTLAKNLGEVIYEIKRITGKPVAVLTNSTLLCDQSVRQELTLADQIFCKLDAWSDDVLRRIDRPASGITLEKIVNGIRSLRNEYKGFLAIQTMILRLPDPDELDRLANILKSIDPDEVQLNLPTRPIPRKYFVESRGNDVMPEKSHTHLKTVSKSALEQLRLLLTEQTGLTILAR